MSASTTEHVTADVLARLRDAIGSMPPRHRPAYTAAALVLGNLARWSRRTPDGFECDSTIGQIVDELHLSKRTVQRSLAAIELAGLTIAGPHGGSRARRGSRRRLTFVSELAPRAPELAPRTTQLAPRSAAHSASPAFSASAAGRRRPKAPPPAHPADCPGGCEGTGREPIVDPRGGFAWGEPATCTGRPPAVVTEAER